MAHHRPDVPPIEFHGREVALPAHRVEGIVRISDGGHGVAALDVEMGLLIRL